jgi:photosystem II stability/assembly factor-like uncharacterized protein
LQGIFSNLEQIYLMKRIGYFPGLLALLIVQLLFFNADAQAPKTGKNPAGDKSWLEMIQDPDVNFYEAQSAFDKYWENRTDYKGNGWKVFKRWEYINQSRVLPDGKLQAPGYVANIYYKYMKDADKSPSGIWSLQGPSAYVGNNTAQPTGMGRINAIAFHPSDANTIFIGSPSGGFWKTTDGGASWTNLSGNLATLGVSSILIHPANPNIIYIGSGDRDAKDAIPMGVFKTTDGGVTWTQINSAMGNVTVGAMVMHPSDPNTIIAATSGGIFKTTNGGNTWSQKATGNFKDLHFKPGDPAIVYAVRIVTPSQFYRSTDGGDSWAQVTSGIPTAGIGSRMVMGVSPANPAYVYLLQIKSSDATLANILRSTDSGLSFVSVATGPNLLGYACDGNDNASQATYDLCMTVDPTNVNNVFVGGVNNWKSSDAGVNWTISSHWIGSSFGEPCGSSVSSVHADQHCFAWSPLNGRLYVGHDGGIHYTANGGTTWTEITNNLAITQIYRIGQGSANVNFSVFGSQDNGCAATTNGTTFTTTAGGDGMECVIDYNNSNYCYNTYHSGITRRSSSGPLGSYSQIAGNGVNGIDESGGWVSPYFLHKSAPSTMFLGLKNVWRSNNIRSVPASSIAWSKISSGETENCLAIEQSPADLNVLYALRANSLKRTDNANAAAGSVTWTTCALPGVYDPTDIKAHPTDANIVYLTVGYSIFKSTDKGQNWTDISGNLPSLFINCLVIDKNGNEAIYIGNQTGVWYKDASLTDWVLFSTGLPPVDIRELEIYYDDINPSNNRIKCATYGRGMWQSDMIEVNVVNPSNFTAFVAGSSQIDLSWTKNPSDDDVVVAWSPIAGDFGQPADGTAYSVGDPIPGGGTVLYVGPATGVSHSALTPSTTYYYKAWSVNGSNQYSGGVLPISGTTCSPGVWTGAVSTDWHIPGNWCDNILPTATTDVEIPGSASNMPDISTTAVAYCRDITIQAGASLKMSAANSTLEVKGNWNMYGSFAYSGSSSTAMVRFNGTAPQTVGGTSASSNLKFVTFDNAAGITLTSDIRGDNVWLTNGIVTTTGASKVYVFGGSVIRTNGWVNGILQKYIFTNPSSVRNVTYEIGDAANYAPVNLSFGTGSITAAGGFSMKTTPGDHAAIASSTLNASKSVNRTWSFPSIGITFSSCNATFNFVSGDLDPGTHTNNLIAGQYKSSVWSYPVVGTKTATSTQATGLASAGLGDIQLAENCSDPDIPVLSSSADPVCSGESVTLSIVSGNLNSATSWEWYAGSCGGTPAGSGPSINVSPSSTTTWYVRGEGGCVTPGACASITLNVNSLPSARCPGNMSKLLSDPPFALSGGNPGGGTYSGPGVSAGTFNPAVAGAGTHTITYTYTDGNGCTGSCTFTIAVSEGGSAISGNILWEQDMGFGVNLATVTLSGDQSGSATTNTSGFYSLTYTAGANFNVTPVKNINKLNGVTVADASAIQQHVANISPLPAPFKRIAADVNKSNSITTLDATVINQALLGNPAALAQIKTSWRFVPSSYTFPNPNAPWGFSEKIVLTGVSGDLPGQDFKGIKIADVVTTFANPANFGEGEPFVLRTNDRELQEGDVFTVEFSADPMADLAAFQLCLAFDPAQLQFAGIEPLTGLPLSEAHFGTYDAAQGEVRVVWAQETGLAIKEAVPVFRLTLRAMQSGAKLSDLLYLGEDILPGKAYNAALEESGIRLVFEQVTTTTDEATALEFRLLPNRPNPFGRNTVIDFVLPEACEAQMRVFSTDGREILRMSKHYPAGPNAELIQLDPADPKGILYYELITPFGALIRKMISLE